MTDVPVLAFRPLYRQVRDVLVRRIADGIWQAGQGIPSEAEIAADLEGQPRHGAQGARRDDGRAAARAPPGARHFGRSPRRCAGAVPVLQARAGRGRAALPGKPGAVRCDRDRGRGCARRRSICGRRASALRIDRLRSLSGEICILEEVQLPATLFPGLADRELPNNLYQLYADEFGVTIARASERLKAVAATKAQGRHLELRDGEPSPADRPHGLRPRRAPGRVASVPLRHRPRALPLRSALERRRPGAPGGNDEIVLPPRSPRPSSRCFRARPQPRPFPRGRSP